MPPTIFRYAYLNRLNLLDRFSLLDRIKAGIMARTHTPSKPTPPRRHPRTSILTPMRPARSRYFLSIRETDVQAQTQARRISSTAATSTTPTSTASTSPASSPSPNSTTAEAEKARLARRNRVDDDENEVALPPTTPLRTSSPQHSTSTTAAAENARLLDENRDLARRIEQLEHG